MSPAASVQAALGLQVSKILSLDASTRDTGFAIFEGQNLIEHGVIHQTSNVLISRIFGMLKTIEDILNRHEIDKIILEDVIPNGTGHRSNPTVFRALMWLQAGINFLVYQKYKKVAIEYLTASQWRSACGIQTGRGVKREALKKADIEFVKKKYDINCSDDEADAIGIGYGYLKLKGGSW